jgi:hypothetical protein
VKTITNAILEMVFLLLYPCQVKGLPGVADCENHWKCNLRNFIFTGGFLPGLIKGLPGVADSENHYGTNAILEICLITGGFLAGLKVYLGSLTVKIITNAILGNLIFTVVFLPGLIKGLPGVTDSENEKQTNDNAGQSCQDIGRPPQIPRNVRLEKNTRRR